MNRRLGRVDSSAMKKEPEARRREKKEAKVRLVKYEDLPEYLKDNEFILDYYRCEWPLKDTFLSLFSMHNESLNIWTHLGGFLIFAAMTVASLMENTMSVVGPVSSFFRNLGKNRTVLISFVGPRTSVIVTPSMLLGLDSSNCARNTSPDANYRHFSLSSPLDINEDDYELIPRWPWFVFLAGAMCCLIFSSVSHLLACHSKRLNIFFWRLDYAGISIMIVCSFFTPVYYAFYCQPCWRLLYLTCITVLGALAIVTLLAPSLSSPLLISEVLGHRYFSVWASLA